MNFFGDGEWPDGFELLAFNLRIFINIIYANT
jgi:hypothetical protein